MKTKAILIAAILSLTLILPIREGFAASTSSDINVNLTVTGCTPNGTCEPGLGETVLNCASDCGCNNNGVCDGSEAYSSCPNDCHCGNGACDYGETANTCSSDCKGDPPVEPPPEPVLPAFAVTNVSAGGITQTSTDITWLTTRPAVCATNIGTTMDYASSSMVEIGYSLSHLSSISGLTPGTLYHYSITCYATSTYSPAASGDKTFTTLIGEAQPQTNVSDLYAVADENYINLYWHNPTNAEFAGVVIRRSLIDYPQINQGEVVYTGKGNSLLNGEVTFQDTGLARNTTYFYSVFAFDSSNNFASGAAISGRTLGNAVLGDATGFRGEPGYTNIRLFWRNPANGGFAGVVIRRSQTGYPNVNGGALVFDGVGSPAANSEVTFNDTGLASSTLYYYTLFAYNGARQYSSGAGIQLSTLAEIIQETTTPTTTPVTTTEQTTTPIKWGATTTLPGAAGESLIFPDFDVIVGGTVSAGRSDGAVLLLPGQSAVISLKGSKALSQTAKMVLSYKNAEGRDVIYLFSYNAAEDTYAVSVPGISDIGSFDFIITVFNKSNSIIKEVRGRFVVAEKDTLFPLAPPIIQEAARVAVNTYNNISSVAQSDTGKTVASAIVGVAAVNAALAFPWWSWINMLQLLFTQPFVLLFGRRKRWGIVYNSITKKPVDLALVRLYDAISGKLIASKVTDSQGRYLFLVDAGEYKMTVEKPGYSFPSVLLNRAKDDGLYADVYYGEDMTIGILGKSAIIANIALDQDDIKISDREALKNVSKEHLKRIIGSLGPVFALLYFIFFPSWFAGSMVAVHLAMVLVFSRFSAKQVRNYWGHVYDRDDKKPIRQAVTRIFSAEYGRMLEYYVTDSQGRYGFLVGPNKYFVTGDKSGYDTYKTREIDLLGKTGEQIIAEDLPLKKSAASGLKEVSAAMDQPAAGGDAEAIAASPAESGTELISQPAARETESLPKEETASAVLDSIGASGINPPEAEGQVSQANNDDYESKEQ